MSGVGLSIVQKQSFLYNKKMRTVVTATASLVINTAYAAVNIFIGLKERSYWFITSGAYYLILAVMRFGIILSERRSSSDRSHVSISFIRAFTGSLLIIMGLVLCGSVYLSIYYDVTKNMNEIPVIAMATYAFTKITLAVINFVKRNKLNSSVLSLIRNIGLADAAVSIFSLQRSMLVTFQGMNKTEINIMNACTGTAVWLFVVLIGIGILYQIIRKKKLK